MNKAKKKCNIIKMTMSQLYFLVGALVQDGPTLTLWGTKFTSQGTLMILCSMILHTLH